MSSNQQSRSPVAFLRRAPAVYPRARAYALNRQLFADLLDAADPGIVNSLPQPPQHRPSFARPTLLTVDTRKLTCDSILIDADRLRQP